MSSTNQRTDPRIAKFRQSAERLVARIEHLRRPLTQNLTPKRNKQLRQRLWESDNLDRTRRALIAVADVLERGTCPAELAHVKNTPDLASLVYKGLKNNGGYYDVIPDDAYRMSTPAALAMQALLDRKPDPARDNPADQSTQANIKSAVIDPERVKRDLDAREADCRLARIPGFFPTPQTVALRMADLASIEPFEQVLEPSAGSGRLIDAALAAQPDCDVVAVERSHPLVSLLETKQSYTPFTLIRDDFLTWSDPDQPTPSFDVVLMNPPFERGADIAHVTHAFTHHLRPGGRLVAIVSSGALYRTDRAAQAFRALVDEWSENPDGIALPSGTFEDTGVSAVILELRKPSIDEPYTELFPCAMAQA